MNRILPLGLAIALLVLAALAFWLFDGLDAAAEGLERTPMPIAAAPHPTAARRADDTAPAPPDPAPAAIVSAAGAAEVRGRVVSARTGAGLAGATVQLEYADSGLRQRTTSDGDGRFRLAGVRARVAFRYWARAPEHAPSLTSESSVTASERRELPDLVLAAGRALRGRVRSSSGAALADASVYLVPHSSIHSLYEVDMFEVFARVFGEERAIDETRTDATGAFVFPNVGPGDFVVAVYALDHQSRFSAVVTITSERDPEPILVEVALGRALRGVVQDAAGQRLAGAHVAVLAEDGRVGLMLKTVKTTTGADGRFEFTTLGPGPHTVFVRADGYAPAGLRRQSPGPDPIVVEMHRGARLEGRLLDAADGRPLGSVPIAVMGVRSPVFRPGVTEPDGTFVLLDVPRVERAMLIAKLDGYSLVVPEELAAEAFLDGYPVGDRLRAEAPVTAPLEIAMTWGGTVTGRVFEAASGRPMTGADVRHVSPAAVAAVASPRGATATTDERGYYTLTNVRPGPVGVAVFADGYVVHLPGDGRFGAEEREPEEPAVLAPGNTLRGHDVYLVRAVLTSGTVVDGAGEPVIGAEVALSLGDASPRRVSGFSGRVRQAQETRTDEAGRFELRAAPPGASIVLRARHPEHPLGGHLVLEVGTGPSTGLEILMERGATLAARFVGPDGNGVRALTVTWVPAGLWSPDSGAPPRPLIRGETDARGHVTLAGLPPGAGRVRIAGTTLLLAEDDERVEVGSGETLERAFSLVAGRRISGRVTRTTGAPVPRAVVVASATAGSTPVADRLNVTATTATDGTYVLDGLAAGLYDLTVIVGGEVSAGAPAVTRTAVPAGAAGQDFELPAD